MSRDYPKGPSLYLDAPDDIAWLKAVHHAPAETQAAILYGREDSPSVVECYASPQPLVTDSPVAVYCPI
jgi:hypothetical protein